MCGCHIISVERFEDDEDVSIVFWEQPFYSLQSSYKIVSYFKRLWSAILGKEWMLYNIILGKDDTEKLREILFLANAVSLDTKNVQDK